MAELRHQIAIAAEPEWVYVALTTEAGLRGWWTVDAKTDSKVGGQAEFGFDKRGLVFRMKLEKLQPGKLVEWSCTGDHPEWQGTTLTWSLSADANGTTLRFVHRDWQSPSEFFAMLQFDLGRADVPP